MPAWKWAGKVQMNWYLPAAGAVNSTVTVSPPPASVEAAMICAFDLGETKLVSRAAAPSVATVAASVPAFSNTKLWAIAIFGRALTAFSVIETFSPALTRMMAGVKRMLSLAVTVKAFAAPAAALGAAAFGAVFAAWARANAGDSV